jgi:hypothetical protein
MKGINVGDCVRLTFADGAVKRQDTHSGNVDRNAG